MSRSRSGPDKATPHGREIVRLAVPAFLALVAEPAYLLADAAIIGHLGTVPLAGLGIAGTVLQTVVGLCVFLAYGTTAQVARQLGAGHHRAALAQGVDGLWLALVIGMAASVSTIWLAGPLVGLFDASAGATLAATTYLRVAALGITPLLLLLAATGVLRGLQDTTTPLVVAVAGNALNVVLNGWLVYGAGLGIAGSAWGSVLAQSMAAGWLVTVVVRAARRAEADLRPDLPGIRRAARVGVALLVRTVTLRASLLVMAWAAARRGDVSLATHQLAMTLWIFLAFALDAIAIAGQAITGRLLGAGEVAATRAATRLMVRWGLGFGALSGVLLAAASPWLGTLFTSDPAVRDLLTWVLLCAALFQPLAGVVFVLDGVLIGAGDGVYLAWAGVVVLAAFAPVALGIGGGLVALWAVFGLLFIGGRAVTLLHRAAGDRWLVTGA